MKKKRSDFIHHQNPKFLSVIREIVFGIEDGMVSTLGALTGIAMGTNDRYIIILSGVIIIMVESISMGIGSFVSTKSKTEVDKRKIDEEKMEIKSLPSEEKKELVQLYIKDGWPKALAKKMALTASKSKSLFIKEMTYRELDISPRKISNLSSGGIFMFFSYLIGGLIPVLSYIFLPISTAVIFSIVITLIGLFILGSVMTKFTKRVWWKAGFEMFFIAGIAAVIGYIIGATAEFLIK